MTRFFYAILLSFISYCSFGQVQVSGRIVSDDNNEGIVGVNVIEKGRTTNGTITDADGKYTINVSGPDAVLVFSFIGYETQEVSVGNQQMINVTMVASLETLNEVVVTAFGIEQEKKALGYSVQEVNGKVLTEGNQPNALNALRGRLSGVNITSSSGAPGAGTTIVIRGVNSLNPSANNQPLFVIDGIPVSNQTEITGGREGATFTNTNRFADINPEDIESISILKGPAASALYGLRAANGAVIVTTKSGRAGKTTYNFKTSYSFDDVYRRPPLQTKYGRGTGGLYVPNDYRADGPPIPAGEKVYDQWDALFKVGHQFQNNFSFSGGTDKATFFGSLGRMDQTGVLPNSEYERTNIKFAGSLKATDKLTIDASANFINSQSINPRSGVGGSGVISYAMRYAPDVDMSNYIDDNGNIIRYSTQLENPLYFAEKAYQQEKLNRFIGNIGLNYKFTDWLTVSYRAGIDTYNNQRYLLAHPTLLITPNVGSVSEAVSSYQEINSNLLVTGKHQFSDDLGLTVSLGNQVTAINSTSVTGSGTGFIVPSSISVNNLNSYTVRSFPTERNIIGVFGDAKLDYKETVFLNITGRNDWSSTLPVQNRSFFYPSVSLGYVFTETLGLATNSTFSYGKLRASYAEVGKDADPYMIGNYYAAISTPQRGVFSVRRSETIGTQNLKPERTKGFEFGAELAFINNRLRLDANYAIQNSVDQIVPLPTSRATGFTTYVINGGQIQNRVMELSIDADIVKSNNFSWTTTVNWTRLRGEVISMPEGVDVITFQPESPWVKQRIQPGGRPGDWYGWKLSRVDDPNSEYFGRLVIFNGYPDTNNNYKGGALAQDTYLGNAFPDWEGGVNNALSYKNFEFSFLFTFRKGGYAFDINRRMRYGAAASSIESPTGAETELRNRLVVFDGVVNTGTNEAPNWVENTQAVVIDPTSLYGNTFRYRLASEFNGFQEASFLRLQTVNLSYSVPQQALSKTPFTNARVTVSGNNLWMTSPFVGFDPEQSAYGSGSNVFGYVGTNIPATRSIYVGLNLTF